MAAQKCKKIFFSKKVLEFLNAYYQKIHVIQSLYFLGCSRPYERFLENQKTRGSKELFPAENNFQNSSTKNFSKNYSHFGGLETNQRHEIET